MWRNAYRFWKIPPCTKEKSPLHVYWFHYRTFNFLTELSIFLQNLMMILAQNLTEKVQLILQLLHPYMFIPTSTVIREMRVCNVKTVYIARWRLFATPDYLGCGLCCIYNHDIWENHNVHSYSFCNWDIQWIHFHMDMVFVYNYGLDLLHIQLW